MKSEITIKIKSKYASKLGVSPRKQKSNSAKPKKQGKARHKEDKRKIPRGTEGKEKDVEVFEHPLIFKEAIINIDDLTNEGQIMRLVDENNKFIAKGYYGRQNKGYGWILTYNEKEVIDDKFFQKRLYAALNRRMAMYNNRVTNAFRVFNGEGDGIGGITIDFYNGAYLVNWYSKGAYKFRDEIINNLKKMTEYTAIYQKKRFNTDGKYIDEDGLVLGKKFDGPLIIKENKIKYATDLNDGAMTGIFLDQREVRKILRDKYSAGRTVLNTFSYAGAFSIAAAVGGATKTTSVDLANRSREMTNENFVLNGINPEDHEIIISDVFEFFKYAKKKELLYHTVILDPPSYAKSKKYTFSAAKDYTDLLIDAIQITKKRGTIIASTNCATFDMYKFKGFVKDAFRENKDKYEIIEEHSLPQDFRVNRNFPEGNYLKVLIIKKL